MTPTQKLRFVERDLGYTKTRVLQQWWEDRSVTLAVLVHDKFGMPVIRHPGEWRDVPLEQEQA